MTVAADTFAPIRFSTEGLPLRERLTAYREMLGRSVGNFEVKATGDEFDFIANSFALPGLGIARIVSSGLRVERPRGEPGRETRDLVLAVMHDGMALTAQRGREVTVKDGDGFLFPTDVVSHVSQRTAARMTLYSLARRDLAPAVSNFDRALLTPLNPETIRLLTGYTALLFREDALASAEFSRLAVSHIHDLIALAVGATRDAAETAKTRGLRAARRADLYARAKRLIALRFDDPDLTSGEVAHQLRVSARHLQQIFAERGETLMTRIWDERVSRAARLLSAPEAADRSITDIAFACGFNDSSHFGRAFAARMGMAPSQWRKRAREQSTNVVE